MTRRSSIARLDPRIREAVDRLVREGQATIDEIVAAIDALGGQASRAAVGRYVKDRREELAAFRQADELARAWKRELEDDPNGDLARLNVQLLHTLAYQAIASMGGTLDEVSERRLALLARTIRDLSTAGKTGLDTAIRAKQEAARTLEQKVEAAAGASGTLGPEALKALIREAYGV